jgi:hypothetical protein
MAQPAAPIRRETGDQGRSHSANFDHRRRPEALRTAMATAFFCPTNTTSRLPLVIDPGPWQRAICQSRQPLGKGAFRPIQTSKKDAGRFTNPVSDDRALLQLEIERSPDQLLRHLEELLGQRHQLVGRQTAMALVHRFGRRARNPRTHPDHRRLFDAKFHGDRVGGLEADATNIAREPVRVLGHDLDGIGAIG